MRRPTPSWLMVGMNKLSHASSTAAALLAALVLITLATGVSQQHFEWFAPASEYGAGLLAAGPTLRLIIFGDDLFIAAYVCAGALLFTRLRGPSDALARLVLFGTLAAGVLDLHENHQLLTMLDIVSRGGALSDETIRLRAELSQLKWMLAHVAFVAAGLAITQDTPPMARALKFALVWVQLPLGAAVWCSDGDARVALMGARYLALISGFALIAWRFGPRYAAAAATGAPA